MDQLDYEAIKLVIRLEYKKLKKEIKWPRKREKDQLDREYLNTLQALDDYYFR